MIGARFYTSWMPFPSLKQSVKAFPLYLSMSTAISRWTRVSWFYWSCGLRKWRWQLELKEST